MNKDLDDRLVPNGEYRDAQNISVGKSEADDIGALENVLGNTLVPGTDLGINNLEIIGHYEDDNNNTIYLFLTDIIFSELDKSILLETLVSIRMPFLL